VGVARRITRSTSDAARPHPFGGIADARAGNGEPSRGTLARLRMSPSPQSPKGDHSMLRIIAGALLLTTATVAAAADGAAVYKAQCAKCHGDTGHADTAVGKALKVPALAGDANVAAMADADVVTKIKTNAKHQAFIKSVSDDDVSAVAKYVKQLAAAK